MSEIIIKFNLPEDFEDSKVTLAAADMHSAIWDFKQDLRSKIKHGEYSGDAYKMLDEINELFNQYLVDNNIMGLF